MRAILVYVDYSICNAKGKELVGANAVTLAFALERIAQWLDLSGHDIATITVIERK